jgi:hypothetical protein
MTPIQYVLRQAAWQVHKLGIRFGVPILLVHYYSALLNVLDLKKTVDIWAKKSELPGVAIDLDGQADRLHALCAPYQ